ncbi:hypothetical protein [Metabacillus indicus]|nr:hypothetical protein [Metabacillus indicus]
MRKDAGLKPFSTTNAEEVKRLNAASGLSYSEVKKRLAERLNEKK